MLCSVQDSKADDAKAAKRDEKDTKNKAKKASADHASSYRYHMRLFCMRPSTKPRRRSSLMRSCRRRRPWKIAQMCSSPSCISCAVKYIYSCVRYTQGEHLLNAMKKDVAEQVLGIEDPIVCTRDQCMLSGG